MLNLTSKSYWLIWPLALLIAANGLIIAIDNHYLRYGAALALLAFLPGWVWIEALAARTLTLLERIVLAVGLSLAITILGAMFIVYLPGAISAQKLMIASSLVTLAGLVGLWWRGRSSPLSQSFDFAQDKPGREGGGEGFSSYILLLLIALILLAAALRLPRLGYAEFHEDEAEALMLGVRLFQGEDYALFLHRKGPAQMLVPVSFWLLTNRIDEALARFPFALSSLLSVVVIFLIGRRWFSWQAGLIAALLWAINGYAIGFGRMVQYQALIFFLGPLAIYCLTLARQHGQIRFLFLGAILLATSLLAHFDALLLLPAAGYAGWLAMWSRPRSELVEGGAEEQRSRGAEEQGDKSPPHPRTPAPPRRNLWVTLLAITLFIILLASFYVPYALDPEFQNTVNYLSETRVRPGLLYNNLDLLRRLDRDYSSHFYLPLLAVGVAAFILLQGSRDIGGKWQVASGKVVGNKIQHAARNTQHVSRITLHFSLFLLALATFWLPNLWRVGVVNLALLPWLALVTFGFWQAEQPAKIAWVMFGAAFIGYAFLVDDPRTHLYILYPGAVLLAGAGLNHLRFWIYDSVPFGYLRLFPKTAIINYQLSIMAFASVFIIGMALIVTYEIAIFLQAESSFTRLRAQWNESLWEPIYDDIPTPREYFGYPKREGWKAIGALRAMGHFPGDFRSINEDFIIPIWYNYGQARSCYDTPAQVFVRTAGLDVESVMNDNYHPTAQINREGDVRLRIFSTNALPTEAEQTYALEKWAAEFDRLATPQRFAQQGQPSRPMNAQFGAAIQFTGFDLPVTTVKAGQTLRLNLYWYALTAPGQDYRAFVHLTDGSTLWAQQDDTPACRLPASIWRAGQRGVGQFRLTLKPDTPPGRYPLIIGLYQAGTLERLQITAGAGKIGDDFLWLGDVEVTAE